MCKSMEIKAVWKCLPWNNWKIGSISHDSPITGKLLDEIFYNAKKTEEMEGINVFWFNESMEAKWIEEFRDL